MADYFVKTASDGGNDGNSGATWALAKATVAGGLAVMTTAGDRLIIAPGRYYPTATTPAVAGTAVAWCEVVGDYDSSITDGGASTSGVTGGYIIFDGTADSTNGENLASPTTQNNNWVYYRFRSLCVLGYQYWQAGPVTNPTQTALEYYDCVSVTHGYEAYVFGQIQYDGANPIKLTRCIGVSTGVSRGAALGSALYLGGSNSDVTNVHLIAEDCMFIGNLPSVYYLAGATTQMYAQFNGCTFLARETSANTHALKGASASYAKADVTDSYARCLYTVVNGVTLGTSTNNYVLVEYPGSASAAPSGWTKISKSPLLPEIPYLMPSSPLIGVLAGLSGTDLFGITRSDDAGAQEYVSGQYPLAPTVDISNLTTVTPGPATTIGGFSRGRVVNAGGI